MAVGLVKHLGPGAGVEAIGVAMQSNNIVPNRLVDRIKNPHLQRFVADFLFDKRVLA